MNNNDDFYIKLKIYEYLFEFYFLYKYYVYILKNMLFYPIWIIVGDKNKVKINEAIVYNIYGMYRDREEYNIEL